VDHRQDRHAIVLLNRYIGTHYYDPHSNSAQQKRIKAEVNLWTKIEADDIDHYVVDLPGSWYYLKRDVEVVDNFEVGNRRLFRLLYRIPPEKLTLIGCICFDDKVDLFKKELGISPSRFIIEPCHGHAIGVLLVDYLFSGTPLIG